MSTAFVNRLNTYLPDNNCWNLYNCWNLFEENLNYSLSLNVCLSLKRTDSSGKSVIEVGNTNFAIPLMQRNFLLHSKVYSSLHSVFEWGVVRITFVRLLFREKNISKYIMFAITCEAVSDINK